MVAESTGTFYGISMTTGDIYTLAGNGTAGFSGDGGAPTSAELAGPTSVTVDPEGDLFIADTDNQRIRMVAASTGPLYAIPMNKGDIYTIAGDGTRGYGGDGGYDIDAELNYPGGVAVDRSRNLIIADPTNGAVRVVAPFAGTFYGQEMTGRLHLHGGWLHRCRRWRLLLLLGRWRASHLGTTMRVCGCGRSVAEHAGLR